MPWRRYVVVLIITSIIFGFTFWLGDLLSTRKVNKIRDIQEQIGVNILSTETRFSLLEKTSCKQVLANKDNDIGFNEELVDLAHRVKFMESQLGINDEKVISLKKYYTLLQIKDYLLTSEFHNRCKQNMVTVLYIHNPDCKDCSKQSVVLDDLVQRYPQIRVYWFDSSIQTPALQTLLSIYKVNETPSIIIDNRVYKGFSDSEKLESYIPEIKKWKKEKELEEKKKNASTSEPINKKKSKSGKTVEFELNYVDTETQPKKGIIKEFLERSFGVGSSVLPTDQNATSSTSTNGSKDVRAATQSSTSKDIISTSSSN